MMKTISYERLLIARIKQLAGAALFNVSMNSAACRGASIDLNGEFDPGSGRTLAACLTHASRARPFPSGAAGGERVSFESLILAQDERLRRA
jgi:hypothetical protein